MAEGNDNKGFEENIEEKEINAPPLEPPTEQLTGYENTSLNDGAALTAPKVDSNVVDSSAPRGEFQHVPILSEDQAKEALLEYVNNKCCYGKKPVNQLVFTDLQSSNTHRYLLQSFYEIRSTKWVHESYHGQMLNHNGMPPPQPWDILVQPKALYQKEKVKLEVPNTAYVKTCSTCHGSGRVICFSCSGSGRNRCFSCGGSGRQTYQSNGTSHTRSCSSCGGSGRKTCFSCHGSGRRTCSTCLGTGRLKWFVELTVKFDTMIDDFFKKSEEIPDEKLRTCQAVPTFTEQNPRIYAINHHFVPEINKASYDLIFKHLTNLQGTRILMQTQIVYAIPMTLCKYKFKEKDYEYCVYGLDKNVHEIDYPHNCLCCCRVC